MDISELVTVVVSIVLAIGLGATALRIGYRQGVNQAKGEIRQSFQIEISKIRANKRQI